jgi:hypothetical protein
LRLCPYPTDPPIIHPSLLDSQVHWFSIINSILIVLFLAFMVAMILIRALNRDISKYNRVSASQAVWLSWVSVC